ncbi:MAG: isoamylase [Clostridiales bacterium]|nr:isoamylase [Clostridiales bacterium]
MQGVKTGRPFPLGVSQSVEGVQFALCWKQAKKCSLYLYDLGSEQVQEIFDMSRHRVGDVYTICLKDKELAQFEGKEYLYEVDGCFVVDPYASRITGRSQYGKLIGIQKGVIAQLPFDWGEDAPPMIPYHNLILYQLHVRGFTKHASSGVRAKGTFRGIMEKIPYLKELGVNALLLLPCYDYNEISLSREDSRFLPPEKKKLNYWGYAKEAFYFTPKASYAKDKENPQNEMMELVKTLHKEGIEVVLDLYFPEGTNPVLILDCLRFWKLTYHIDGFRINDNVAPCELLAKDPLLGGGKLFSSFWREEEHTEDTLYGRGRSVALLNDEYLGDVRRFLKGDEGMVRSIMYRIKRNPKHMAVINNITNVNGFTLMDLVSYDVKHNEENGENGRDGTDYNYSWNCGKEGETKNKQVLYLRKKQIMNAYLLMFFSQGTPMLLAGDEFLHTQKGNNNPYCQDNTITWLNWNRIKTNEETLTFVKELIAFRKCHPILHRREECMGSDYLSFGSPDLSFHGTKAWFIDDSNYSRLLAFMLNGAYQVMPRGKRDQSFYVACNMHWEPHSFDLPSLPKGYRWKCRWDTAALQEDVLKNQRSYLVKPRTIVVLESEEAPL